MAHMIHNYLVFHPSQEVAYTPLYIYIYNDIYIPLTIRSMGISGSYNGGTVPYKTIFCGDILLHRPKNQALYMVGTFNLGS